VPRVARTPAELASCNVAASLVYNGGFLVGSLGAGVLLAATSAATTFAVLGGAFGAAIVPLLRVEADPAPELERDEHPVAQAAAGFRIVAGHSQLRELVLLTTLLPLVDGALDVLIVVAALGFLDVGEAGAGYLISVWGLGCIAGSGVVLMLLGRDRLTTGLTLGALVFGSALALIGLVPSVVVAVVSLLVFGIGETLVEVAAATLLQRLTPDHVLARVAGVVETTTVAALAFGSLAAGLLADAIGARSALVVVAALLPAVVLARRARLARLEAGAPVPEREYRLLREHAIFAPLPIADVEYLARTVEELRPDDGAEVITQGTTGDRFYLIAAGLLDAFEDGEHMRTMSPGDGFGEIALLRDVPRTATVQAQGGVVLLALDRDTFLEAVSSQPPSKRAATRLAEERLPAER
jgi:hypothetical protein